MNPECTVVLAGKHLVATPANGTAWLPLCITLADQVSGFRNPDCRKRKQDGERGHITERSRFLSFPSPGGCRHRSRIHTNLAWLERQRRKILLLPWFF